MAILSFDEYFKTKIGHIDETDQLILDDAKKILSVIKSPREIDAFKKMDVEEQDKLVSGLDPNHSGASFSMVCACARAYANYRLKEAPYTFDEFFEGYHNYAGIDGSDEGILKDAKKVYETLKVPTAIALFAKMDPEIQYKMVKGLDDGHSGFSFASVCHCALRYAKYNRDSQMAHVKTSVLDTLHRYSGGLVGRAREGKIDPKNVKNDGR